jgi:predicted ATP-grasp superfamily ATP-dependent carboligase
MHLFLYEWITGGGLVEQPGPLPESMLAEGSAMVAALAADFSALADCQVTVLRDIRLDVLSLPACDIVDIHSALEHADAICRFSAAADLTLVIAPEFDDLLLNTVKQVVRKGGNLLSAGESLVALAADKRRTSIQLATSGIPVPVSVLLAADQEKLPIDFNYPGVLKPIHGAGSQHTLLVAGASDEPDPHPWPRILERYHPGIPASVALLCGPAGIYPLPPCRQHLSTDGRFTYLGGSLIQDPELAKRATVLAQQAIAAMPMPHGYLGVDLVLGESSTGEEDVIIEINPRLTTSYIGLRQAATGNIASAMLDVAAGRTTNLSFRAEPLKFSVPHRVS